MLRPWKSKFNVSTLKILIQCFDPENPAFAGAYLEIQIYRCHCIRYLKILRVPIAPFYLKFWNFVGANTSTNFCGCLAPMAPSINRSLLYIKEKWADRIRASQNIHRYIVYALGENLILLHKTGFVRIFICQSVFNYVEHYIISIS